MAREARALSSEKQGYFPSHHHRPEGEGAAPPSLVIFVISSHQIVTQQTRLRKIEICKMYRLVFFVFATLPYLASATITLGKLESK